jgi:hypothetical protein
MTDADIPPPGERPRKGSEEQEHLREDSGMTAGLPGPGEEVDEHLREDTGMVGNPENQDDRGSIEKIRDKLKRD